jgi:sarcosine oxidase
VRDEYEYVVIGLGGLGSAALYWLARRGCDVLGVEQFTLGHDRGASQDHSRIIRLSYHHPAYVRLATDAYAAWGVLEADAGETLIIRTGGLDLWPANAAIPMSDYTSSLEECGVAFDILDAGSIRKQWPQFTVDDDVTGLWQAEGGIVAAARCNAAHIRLAQQHGASILEGSRVTSIRDMGGEFEISGDDFSIRAEKLIVAADAWTNDVLRHFEVEIPLTITQEQVTYFAPDRLEDYMPDRFPVWIWMDEPAFYGIPVYGAAGIKIGQDVGGRVVTAESRDFDVDQDALARVSEFLERHIPSARESVIYTKSCLYTMPPDRDFIIDRLTGFPGVVVLQGAAHGFKFASVFGKIGAELAVDGKTGHDIGLFSLERSQLRDPTGAKSFLI